VIAPPLSLPVPRGVVTDQLFPEAVTARLPSLPARIQEVAEELVIDQGIARGSCQADPISAIGLEMETVRVLVIARVAVTVRVLVTAPVQEAEIGGIAIARTGPVVVA